MASTERMSSPTLAAVAPAAAAAAAAHPSPPAIASATALAPGKKRKASDVPSGCRETGSTSTHCSLCGFGASTLDHLLTHVREAHDRSHAAASPMGTFGTLAQLQLLLRFLCLDSVYDLTHSLVLSLSLSLSAYVSVSLSMSLSMLQRCRFKWPRWSSNELSTRQLWEAPRARGSATCSTSSPPQLS